jgi:hypothetical protein
MSEVTEQQLAEWIQTDPDAVRQIAERLNAGHTQEQFNAAVQHRARGLSEYERFQRHFGDIMEDEEKYAAAVQLDKQMAERYPNMSERDRFSAVGETVRRGFGEDLDRAREIARQQAYRRRAQEEAGKDAEETPPTKADLEAAESEAEHDAFVSEGIAQLVRSRGPQALAPRTEEQKLRDERIALEKRRKAAGW